MEDEVTEKAIEQTSEKLLEKQVYNTAIKKLVNQKQNSNTVIHYMIDNGIEQNEATVFVNDCMNQINLVKKETAKKDILYGALWCIGGIVAILVKMFFIFVCTIIYGGIQLVRGLINYSK